jgi:hypothetical protein
LSERGHDLGAFAILFGELSEQSIFLLLAAELIFSGLIIVADESLLDGEEEGFEGGEIVLDEVVDVVPEVFQILYVGEELVGLKRKILGRSHIYLSRN